MISSNNFLAFFLYQFPHGFGYSLLDSLDSAVAAIFLAAAFAAAAAATGGDVVPESVGARGPANAAVSIVDKWLYLSNKKKN